MKPDQTMDLFFNYATFWRAYGNIFDYYFIGSSFPQLQMLMQLPKNVWVLEEVELPAVLQCMNHH